MGALWSAILAAAIPAAVSALISALIKNLFGVFDRQETARAHEELGASRVTTKIAQENADASARMARAAVNRVDVDRMLDDMRSGKF